MNIPDPAVWAILPMTGTLIGWSLRMIIKDVTTRDPKTTAEPLAAPANPAPANPSQATISTDGYTNLSARDWLNITAAIEKSFNGRYLLASEFRLIMEDMRKRQEDGAQLLHNRISALGHEMNQRMESLRSGK